MRVTETAMLYYISDSAAASYIINMLLHYLGSVRVTNSLDEINVGNKRYVSRALSMS